MYLQLLLLSLLAEGAIIMHRFSAMMLNLQFRNFPARTFNVHAPTFPFCAVDS